MPTCSLRRRTPNRTFHLGVPSSKDLVRGEGRESVLEIREKAGDDLRQTDQTQWRWYFQSPLRYIGRVQVKTSGSSQEAIRIKKINVQSNNRTGRETAQQGLIFWRSNNHM